MAEIFLTEASIVNDIIGRAKGKITKLAGAIDNSKIRLYIKESSFRELPINLVPVAKLEIEVDKRTNILSVTTNKEISPLKKGDSIKFHFDDKSFFEASFLVGRTLSGKEATNFLLISDLQFWQLTQSDLIQITINSGLGFVYDFIDKSNDQYLDTQQGRRLFKLMCERLVDIKRVMLNIDRGWNAEDNPTPSSNIPIE